MSNRSSALFLVLVLALGVGACGAGNDLTAPDGGVYLEIRDNGKSVIWTAAYGNYAFSDGGIVNAGDALKVTVRFHARGEAEIKTPVTASASFVFEDGTVYENKALVYGPFTGYGVEVSSTFRIQDGLLQVAQGKRNQLISFKIKFSNGQEFPIFGFYIR